MMSRERVEADLSAVTDEILELRLVLSDKQQAQEHLIVQARIAGMSLRAIAECCLCSHQTIANVIARSEATNARSRNA